MPRTIVAIGASAFENCGAITDVYYLNYAELWADVVVSNKNTTLQNADFHCMGDLSDDDKVNVADSMQLFAAASGKRTLSDTQKLFADINGDGKVNVVDSALLFKKISGK